MSELTRKLSGDRCRCSSCGLYFNSTAAFDKHRVGSWRGVADRRCLAIAEMKDRGMAVNASGYWVTALNPNPLRHRMDEGEEAYLHANGYPTPGAA
jgi:hypothetical protein